MKDKPNLILIARVSTTDQRVALPAQKMQLLEYADKQGYKSDEFEYHEFDETAHHDTGKKFALLVQHLKSIKGPLVIVFDKIDRFSRDSSSDERKELTKIMRSGRAEMHFPSDNLFITKDSPAADLFRLDIGVALASYYSSSIRDNVKRRFKQLLADGNWPHRAPIGYLNHRTSEKVTDIIIDTKRAHYIVQAFEMRSQGLPYEIISMRLASDGFRSASGKVIGKSYMEKILTDSFYCGTMIHAGKKYPHRYKPIISKALFQQCQDVKKQRGHDMTRYASEHFTLKRIPKCGRCGRAVSSYYGKGNVYLRCAGTGKQSCGNPNTPEVKLLPGIEADLFHVTNIPDTWIDQIIDELRKRHDDQQLYFTNSIQQTRREYDIITNRLKSMYYDRLDGRISVEAYDEMANELESKQQVLNEQLKSLTSDNKTFAITASYLLDLAQRSLELFKSSNADLRQQLLDYMLSNVELSDQRLSYILIDPFKEIAEANKKALHAPNSEIWQGWQVSNHLASVKQPLIPGNRPRGGAG